MGKVVEFKLKPRERPKFDGLTEADYDQIQETLMSLLAMGDDEDEVRWFRGREKWGA